jgi:hypothetical protein
MAYPATARFDITGDIFSRQLNKLRFDNITLYRRVLQALQYHTDESWSQFAAAAKVDFYETSFDGSYTIIGFNLLNGKIRLAAQIIDDVIVIGSFHKPIIHIDA